MVRSKGAAQSIENAATLAMCLRGIGRDSACAALTAYEERRRPRASAIQAGSHANATTFHLADGPDQQARDDKLAADGFRGGRAREAELYGYDAEAA